MIRDAGEPKLIFILGMHRSGTSALTRMINLLGADLGQQLLDPEEGVNDRGFWENAEIIRINEAILGQLDSTWYDYRSYPPHWWQEAPFAPLREEIRQWLHKEFPSPTLVALKDPRLCRTLPLWLEAAQQAGFSPRCILVTRSPEEVRRSLTKRDPFSPLTADLLWLRYLEDAHCHSQATRRTLIDYEDILNNQEAAAKDIGEALGILWPNGDQATQQAIGREIDPGLRHQLAHQDDPAASPISAALEPIYQTLKNHRLPDEASSSPIRQLLEDHATCALPMLGSNRRLVDTTAAMQQLGGQLEYARHIIAQREAEKQHSESQLQQLGQQHQQALEVINERDQQLEQCNQQMKQRDQQLAQRNQEFLQLESWAKEMEQTASAHWQTLEAIRSHPMAGRLLRLLKL